MTFDRGRGWVPARHLDIRGDTGVVVNGYDTTELSTSAGEELEVVERDDESGDNVTGAIELPSMQSAA